MFPLRDDRPTYTPPLVTTMLILACVFVFLHEIMLDEFSRNYFMVKYAVVPARFAPLTLITSLFLHGGWTHIIGNMLFLWAFGRSLEDAMGHGKFLGFYLLCGVIAGIAQIFFATDPRIPTVGASGAIAGVMGAYLIKFPKAWIHTLVFIFVFITTVEIPAWFYTIFWFVTQLFNGIGSITTTQVAGGGTAWFAHIGGFIAGMILVSIMGTRNRYVRRHVVDRW
ncbi:MAG TPA: rhomboid family intramembrane serine protease [Bryobacteraceae bacterium]|jgi:membrane associated rhomboid family serine protease|nr:rhomboid family intramembrane serine protease [Bryobacteraceae bacterium]